MRTAILLLVLTGSAYAQGPDADWRTVTTPHFRVHYPRESEAWSMRAASRLESIRDAVIAEVGFAPDKVTDVLVMNPYAEANGITLPLLDTPRIVLYTEPPDPGEQIGDYSDWIDLLVVHEMTHLVHLMRPSRNPGQRLLARFLPLDPITLGAPRWVLEGYATVVEGRITAAGRPNSTLRAAILRKWAASGRLPTYGQLNSDQRFLGMSMAYLLGSAYLEWLEERGERGGAGSLKKLWARMTARQRRSFDEAFLGVYGESPARLYGTFTADLTERAVTIEHARPREEGALWQETSRGSGDPDVSPDGKQIVIVSRGMRGKPAKLVVWSTGPATEEESKLAKRIERILQRDPEDVPPLRAKPLERKPLHSFTAPDGGDIETPRWLPNGRSILYVHRQPDREGFLHRDLFRWDPEEGTNERITHLADLGDADPFPDGRHAVAVRNRDGFSQLVTVNLLTAEVTARTEPSLEVVYTHPRVNADGKRIAYAAHEHDAWRVIVDGESKIANAAFPEWRGDDLYATVFRNGFIDLVRAGAAGEVMLTRSSGGAFQSAPSPDGRVFFMGLEPDGFVIRVLEKPAAVGPSVTFDRSLVPALPPTPPHAVALDAKPVSASRPYALGRQEPSWMFGCNVAPSAHTTELGVRLGDVVGRLDTIAVVSLARGDSPRGAALATVWRGWPVGLGLHLYDMQKERGAELRAFWSRQSLSVAGGGLFLECGGKAAAFESGGCATALHKKAFLEGAFRARQLRGSMRTTEELRLAAESGHHIRAVVRGSATLAGIRLGATYQRDHGDITVGGLQTSILPRSAVASRVLDPALPIATLTGNRYEGRRIDAMLGNVTAFYQQHRTRGRLALAGLEVNLRGDAMPLLKTPAYDLTAGAARILDAPFERRIRWWIGLRWHP